jgi:hypothetical protein
MDYFISHDSPSIYSMGCATSMDAVATQQRNSTSSAFAKHFALSLANLKITTRVFFKRMIRQADQ